MGGVALEMAAFLKGGGVRGVSQRGVGSGVCMA